MTAKKTAKAKQSASNKPKIYVGPSFKGVVSGTVFTNGLTPSLSDAIKAVPAIAELVIPVCNLSEANKKLADPDSALSRIHRKASAYKKGE